MLDLNGRRISPVLTVEREQVENKPKEVAELKL